MATSWAALLILGGGAFGQQPTAAPVPLPPITTKINPTEPPRTQWSAFPQSAVTTPGVPIGTIPQPVATPAPISTQPGLVSKTLTFQKSAGETAPQSQPVVQPVPAPPLPLLAPTPPPLPEPPVLQPIPSQPAALPVPALPTAFTRNPAQDTNKKDTLSAYDKEKEKSKENEKDEGSSNKKSEYKPMVYTPPNKQDVFRLASDQELDERIRAGSKNAKEKFPEVRSKDDVPQQFQPRVATASPMMLKLQPSYVVHRRLYFEETNGERAGWDFGVIQPFISTAYFTKDVFFLPHKIGSGFWKNRWDTNIGKCPPGANTPYYLYPPGFTVSGLMLFSTFYTGLPFIFP
jgi:hypothetical protein